MAEERYRQKQDTHGKTGIGRTMTRQVIPLAAWVVRDPNDDGPDHVGKIERRLEIGSGDGT